ncbi:Transcriptional regulator, LysR family [Pseudoalteromonas luteoviolacea B = ATCC 29581]|nr:Transcriptional regulator, LysR family [Pseudoalteromonas luteoviolacea B = ATCC 29581]
MINPVWLKTFCTLVEIGHFTRTAEKLHMTQSGVSQHIQKLEEYLKQKLIIREAKQFTLTPSGEQLFQRGQIVLVELDNLAGQVIDDPPFEGEVNIMSPGSIGLQLYPHLLSLQQSHRKLMINYRFAPNEDIEQAVSAAKADIGIVTEVPKSTEVKTAVLTKEPLVLVTPRDIIEPSWDALQNLGFINHPDGFMHAQKLFKENYPEFQYMQQFSQSGFSNQIGLILEPVSRGLGFSVLPLNAALAFTHTEKIHIHRLANPVVQTLFLIEHKHKARSNRLMTILHSINSMLT